MFEQRHRLGSHDTQELVYEATSRRVAVVLDTLSALCDPEKCVRIDVGIIKYAHDSDRTAVEGPNLADERERLEREQRKLSRKDHGSVNYREQQHVVARRHADLKRKRRDFLHKLSAYYAREYNLIAVEALNAKRLMELPSNSRD